MVKVDENSVIIIRRMERNSLTGNVPNLEIVNGLIEAFADTRMKIKTPNGASTIIPEEGKGRVRIEVSEKTGTKILIIEGKGITAVGNEALEIKSGEGVTVRDRIPDKVVKLLAPPEIVEPADGQIYSYLGEKLPNIQFKFGKSQHGIHLEIAVDENFVNLVFKVYSTDNLINVNSVGQGDYFWRVALVDEEGFHGIFSKNLRLKVLIDEGPRKKPPTPVAAQEKVPELPAKERSLVVTSEQGKAEFTREGKVQDISRGAGLRAGRSVNVPYNSSVELSFNREASMELRQATKIVLDKTVERGEGGDKEIEVSLKEGSVYLNLQKVEGKNVTYVLKAIGLPVKITTRKMKNPKSDILIEKQSDGSTKVINFTGRIAINAGDSEKQLTPNTFITIYPKGKNSLKVEKVPVFFSRLEYGKKAKIFYDLELPMITYRWPGTSKAYLFELASNPLFRPVMLSEFSDGNYLSNVSPKEGKYYWRYKDGAGKASATQEFSVFRIVELCIRNPQGCDL